MVLDASLINSQHYNVQIKGKRGIQVKEQLSPLHLGAVAIEKEAFWSSSTTVRQLVYIYIYIYIFMEVNNGL